MEKGIVKFLNKYRWKFLDSLSLLISKIAFLSSLWILVIILALIIDLQSGIRLFIEIVIVFIIHYVISECIIKHGAKRFSLIRTRPYIAFPEEIRMIGKNFSDSSFPSSHVSSVIGGLIVVYAAFPSAWPALVVFAILLSLSRLYNGMHYPTDVLAGIILGFIYGFLTLIIAPEFLRIFNLIV